jgi:hypothetical protein
MRRAAVLGVIVGGALAWALLGGSAGRAHFQTYEYTLRGCPAAYERQVDPINIVYTGYADAARTVNHIGHHTSWDRGGGGTQSFSSHGVCGEMYAQKATGCGVFNLGTIACDRFHIRVKKTYHSDGTLGATTRGDAHHEDWVDSVWTDCWPGNHAVDSNGSNGSGFDQGRRQMRMAFRDGYDAGNHWWFSRYWGNTRNFKQCDGDYAGSDGYTVYIRLHKALH